MKLTYETDTNKWHVYNNASIMDVPISKSFSTSLNISLSNINLMRACVELSSEHGREVFAAVSGAGVC